jgi:hypothetical protein
MFSFSEKYPTCSIDLKVLESLDIFEILDRSLNMTDEDLATLYHVQPGGSWAPKLCSPSLKG